MTRRVPSREESFAEVEARLVAEGKLKLPEKKMDWDEFFALPSGNVSRQEILEAVRWAKGDR